MISLNTCKANPGKLKNTAHVWYIPPESVSDPDLLQHCHNLLSDKEQEQFERFLFPKDSHLYLVAHAMLRSLLSRYANIAPRDWQFGRGNHGRPEITNKTIHGLRFNLTHTEGLAACIMTFENDCGIDAEHLVERSNPLGVAQRMFSRQELEQLTQCKGQAFLDYFYSCWTLREAYVKARGIGINFPTRQICFRNHNTQITATFDTAIDDHADNWHFQLLHPDDTHVLAVALRRTADCNKRIITREFSFHD